MKSTIFVFFEIKRVFNPSIWASEFSLIRVRRSLTPDNNIFNFVIWIKLINFIVHIDMLSVLFISSFFPVSNRQQKKGHLTMALLMTRGKRNKSTRKQCGSLKNSPQVRNLSITKNPYMPKLCLRGQQWIQDQSMPRKARRQQNIPRNNYARQG